MAKNIMFARGGTSVVKFPWCEGEFPEYTCPFHSDNLEGTPPYDSKFDGAYGSGLAYFTAGMPFSPSASHNALEWQRKQLMANKPLAVGDFIGLILVPFDHYVTFVNVKVQGCDPNMAGATVFPDSRVLEADGCEFDPTETEGILYRCYKKSDCWWNAPNDVTPIALDKPSTKFISCIAPLEQTNSNEKGDDIPSNVDNNYGPLIYSVPPVGVCSTTEEAFCGQYNVLGFRIVTLPTDTTVNLWDMRNALYMSAKIEGFDCPTSY